MSTINPAASPKIAIIVPGDSMWIAWQTPAALRLVSKLRDHGLGNQPLDYAFGTSSGAIATTLAASGNSFQQEDILPLMLKLLCGSGAYLDKMKRYRQGMEEFLNCGLVDFDAVLKSHTQLVLTASHCDLKGYASGLGSRAIEAGLRILANESPLSALQSISDLDFFLPHYFSNKLIDGSGLIREFTHLQDRESFKTAIRAAARIPVLAGGPIIHNGKPLIDGVFAPDISVIMAVELGATDVFVFTSGKNEKLYEQPIQSRIHKGMSDLLKTTQKVPQLKSSEALQWILDQVPPVRPINIDKIKKDYPGTKVYFVTPEKNLNLSRFWESDPKVLRAAFEGGIRAMDRVWEENDLANVFRRSAQIQHGKARSRTARAA